MKKARILLACAFVTLAVFASKPLFAGGIEVVVDNCFETGNIQDVCGWSDGEQNIWIPKCKPGYSSCGYTLPN